MLGTMADQSTYSDQQAQLTGARAFTPPRIQPDSNRVRLQTSVRLRWLAVVGQALAVIFVRFVLGFPLPLGLCFGVIAVSAWLNIFLTIRYPANLRLRNRYAAFLLAYDIVQLAVLVALTGGLENPFSLLFLVPTTVSASTLPLRWTLLLEGLTLLCISLVTILHLPLPWYPGEVLLLPSIYIASIWTALVCSLGFTSIYAWRIAEENRRMSDALAASEAVLAREQQLSALDGLAAAAAHELGTPLATIALVAKELKRELPNADDFAEDLDLLDSQAQRCREIMSSLTARGASGDAVLKQVPLLVMLGEIAEAQPTTSKTISIITEGVSGDNSAEPVINRNPAILYGIGNLAKNALDFAHTEAILAASWSPDTISIEIRDDGPGFTIDILGKLGEPYVTTKPSATPGVRGEQPIREGMGLGFFIAKTLLERTGAQISLANRPKPPGGAIVKLVWPRGVIEPD